jgi:hypothetical protein
LRFKAIGEDNKVVGYKEREEALKPLAYSLPLNRLRVMNRRRRPDLATVTETEVFKRS